MKPNEKKNLMNDTSVTINYLNQPFLYFVEPAMIRKQIGVDQSNLPKAGNSKETQKFSGTR